jgi:transmembrane sensor
MTRPERPLGEHMMDATSEIDVSRQWRRIEAQLGRPRSRPRGWLAACGAVGAAAALVLVLAPRRGRPLAPAPIVAAPVLTPEPFFAEGTRVESTAGTKRELALPDGSRIALRPGGVLTLARSATDEVRVVLERGSADLDVIRDSDRRFVVAVLDVEFVVAGARFVVSVSEGAAGKIAAAEVERGAIEVHRSIARSVLLAGESWTSGVSVVSAGPGSTSDDAPVTSTPRTASSGRATDDDARSLLAVATRARWQGRQRDAARALDELCRRFPNDPRAALAAFELGRIQLDTLHEAGHAAASFRTAMNLARDPVLREDAATRRVEALDRSHDGAACLSARAAYLAEYSTGAHAGRVTASCRDR